jgi:MFS family permease
MPASTATGGADPPLLSGPFLRVLLANFFFFLNFASFFLLPLHIKALGGNEAVVGAVMGSAGVAGLVVLPVVGFAIDRYGRRRFLVFGTIAMTVLALGFLFVDDLGPGLFALRVLQGVSFSAAFTAAATLAAELAPPARRAEALGLFGISTLSTHAIAPAIGEEIVRRGGFRALFVAAALLSVFGLGFIRAIPRGAVAGAPGVSRAPWRMDRTQWILAATMVCCGLAFGAVVTFIPTFVATHALGRVGMFFSLYTAAAVATRLVGGGLSDAIGRRAVVVPALLLLAAAIALLPFVRGAPLLATAAVLFGLAQGFSYPTLNAFAIDLSAAEHLGRAQALFNGAFNLGVTSSAFGFGAVAARYGYRPMFALAATTPLLGCALFYAATRGRDVATVTGATVVADGGGTR